MTTIVNETSVRVTEPGVYDGMPDRVYHADPVPGGSLSSSGARKLLPPHCPARYAYDRDHPPASTPEFDLGHAAHRMVLGVGPDLAVIQADDWRTRAAREERADAYARGEVPVLSEDYQRVADMAAALRADPVAGGLFDPASGRAEQSLFWVDDATGVWRRGRLDWLPTTGPGRLVISDYKTCKSAAPDAVARAMADYGYHLQAAWYLDGARVLLGAEDPAFVLVCQEKTPPYLVTVAQPDSAALRAADRANRQALNVYRTCVDLGEWPGYTDDVESIALPAWADTYDAVPAW